MSHTARVAEAERVATLISSPVGELQLVADPDGALVLLQFVRREDLLAGAPPPSAAGARVLAPVVTQLEEYFAGARREFDVALRLRGPAFHRAVWSALQQIPYGATASYGEIARRIGKPAAVRAVGSANGANPVAIIVPCHRVIGADGRLVGYGGGLERKRLLLDLEQGRLPLAP